MRLSNISAVGLKRIVFILELVWVFAGAMVYYFFQDQFWMYLPLVAVINILTLTPLFGILKKLNNADLVDSEVSLDSHLYNAESTSKLISDAWEKACVGYYVLTNGLLITFVLYLAIRAL